jgi:adenosine deaminase
MSVESFVRAMPKVELHVHLEGAIQKDRLLVIAEHNEIADELRHFSDWVKLLDQPDYKRLEDLINTTTGWLRHPDDLAHVVYEMGVNFAKQNIRYAEVSVNPIRFTESGWTFETFLKALNDGRNRAERGWGVQLRWVLTIPRDLPRHADEIVRWASSSSGQNGGIVGINLRGPENVQPVGQFERAFRTAAKKHLPRMAHAGDVRGAEGILETLAQLEPSLLLDGWGTAQSRDVQNQLIEKQIPLVVCLTKALRLEWIKSYTDYPLRQLLDEGVTVLLCADMPSYYKTSLTDEYLACVQHCGLDVEELESMALNALQASQLPAAEKASVLETFRQEYDQLRQEHLG